jgi:hypothetical protein
VRTQGSVLVHGEIYVWPPLQTRMRSFSKGLWFVVALNSHASTNDWGALICVRTARKKCALLKWSAVNAPQHGKATFFFEQLRSIIRFIPECANTTLHFASMKWALLPSSCTLSWPVLCADIYMCICVHKGYSVFWWFFEMLNTRWKYTCCFLILRTNATALDHSGSEYLNCFFYFW